MKGLSTALSTQYSIRVSSLVYPRPLPSPESKPWDLGEASLVLASMLRRIRVRSAFLIHSHVHLRTKGTKSSCSKLFSPWCPQHSIFLPLPTSPELLSLPMNPLRAKAYRGLHQAPCNYFRETTSLNLPKDLMGQTPLLTPFHR